MKLKTIKILTCIITIGLSFLTHNIYSWFPDIFTSIFFPVNESIWEHMKMLYTTILIGEIIAYFIIKYFKINVANFLLSISIKAFFSIPIFLIIYLPIYYTVGENLFINITVMIITLIIVEIISYFMLKQKTIVYSNIIAIIFIVICYIVLSITTFYPIKNDLFYDPKNHSYGINIYEI